AAPLRVGAHVSQPFQRMGCRNSNTWQDFVTKINVALPIETYSPEPRSDIGPQQARGSEVKRWIRTITTQRTMKMRRSTAKAQLLVDSKNKPQNSRQIRFCGELWVP